MKITLWEKNFYVRYEIGIKFLLEVNNVTIHKAIKQFQAYINNGIKYLDHIYYSYSRFIYTTQITYLSDNNLVIIIAFDTYIIYYYYFDYYNYIFGLFNFHYYY